MSLCGVNLKKLWCEFACSPNLNQFTKGLGWKNIEVAGKMINMTEIGFAVDDDMACTLFKSCEKVSLIA